MVSPDSAAIQEYEKRLSYVLKMERALRTPLGRAAAWAYAYVPLYLWEARLRGVGKNMAAITVEGDSHRALLALERGEKVELSMLRQCEMIQLTCSYQRSYLKKGFIQNIPDKLAVREEEFQNALSFLDTRSRRQMLVSERQKNRSRTPRRRPRKF